MQQKPKSQNETPSRPKRKRQETANEKRFRFMLFVMIAAMLLWLALPAKHHRAEFSSVSPRQRPVSSETGEFQDRVQFHLVNTGRKINRERIGAQLDNFKGPRSRPDSAAGYDPNEASSSRLPLVPETHPREGRSDRSKPENPMYGDVQVQDSLRFQQEAIEWEERAREAYIAEFVANVRRAGGDVKVMSNGDVVVLREPKGGMDRMPNSVGPEPEVLPSWVRPTIEKLEKNAPPGK